MGLFTGIIKHLTGTGYFNASSVNASVIGNGQFVDSTQSSGIITNLGTFAGTAVHSGSAENGQFNGDSINTGIIANHGEFFGYSMNLGSVLGLAEFHDNSNNTGTSLYAAFADTSVNTGSVQTATFSGSSVNQGVITGNAIFADTTTNNGLVQGNAQFAATATNSGAVSGTISEYVSGAGNWYDDTSFAHHTVTLSGNITQSDEGSGVVGAKLIPELWLPASIIDTGAPGNFNGDFTVELFLKPSPRVSLYIGNHSWQLLLTDFYDQEDVMVLTNFNNNLFDGGAGGIIKNNQWNHIAFVYTAGTQTTYAYVNGELAFNSNDFDTLPIPNVTSTDSITIETNMATLSSLGDIITGFRVSTTARYSGASIIIPTSVFTSDADTKSLLNFGATSLPAVMRHPFAYDNYWGSTSYINSGTTILYIDPYLDDVAANVSFDDAYGPVTTDGSGVASYTYTHNQNVDAYWFDGEYFDTGTILYLGQHINTVAANISFTYPGEYNGALYLDLFNIVTDQYGVLTVHWHYTHSYPHDAYWSNDEVLVNGSILYIEQHLSAVADTISFTEGNKDISTNSSGEVTWPYHGETFTDSINLITYYADARYPATGDILYTYPYRNVVAASALSFVVQYEGWDYSLTTDINGVVTRDYAFNHPYQHYMYWSDDEGLINGTSILYDNPHANPNYPGVQYQNWTGGGTSAGGGYNFSTDAAGVVSWSYIFSWSYPHGDYWSGDATLVNGSILYTEQHFPTLATNVSFDEGNQTIDTDGNGAVTLSLVINHPYQHDAYWSDDATLVNGSILYTGQHSPTLATNVSFDVETQTIDTDGSGVVSIGYKWLGTSTCNSVLPVTLYTSSSTLANGVTLRTARAGIPLDGSSFAYERYLYFTNGQGVITATLACTAYN